MIKLFFNRFRLRSRFVVALFAILAFIGGVGIAFALPPEPIDPEPIVELPPRTPPDNGFEWRMPSRFGIYENGIVDFHWDEASAAYEPEHVNPADFTVIFDGCRTDEEESTGVSALTYAWVMDGQTVSGNACRLQHDFAAQGPYTVTLTITQLDGTVLLDDQGRGNPFTQSIVVKDYLIVSLGDSYASGEGSPDARQVLGSYDITGQPTAIETPVRWQDRRCHRSANSSPAQAARMLESADPHSSVTFISFACSGATINANFYKDASNYDPYRDPQAHGYTKLLGSGILGPYAGPEPPDPDRPQDNQLPSQIDQLMAALTNNGQVPPRPVDALLISGGGNDIGFGNIAQLCTLYHDCENIYVTDARGWGPVRMEVRVNYDVSLLPGRYAALAAAINANIPFTPNGKVYITQYPDSTRDDQGNFCDRVAWDIIPSHRDVLLGAGAILEGAPIPTKHFSIAGAEVAWAGGHIIPALNAGVGSAAQAHGWVLVDGIADATANLFSGHGYCASDNWIRRASESVMLQGPWIPWYQPYVLPPTVYTRGTLHPTTRGYQVIAERIFAEMSPFLLPAPPQNPPTPPTFSSASNNSVAGANGWLTGQAAGVSCPAGAAQCAFAQVTAATASGTEIRGASLLVNDAPASCSTTGVTINGVTCQTELVNAQTYNWSLSFANDGIYRLDFSTSARNGTVSTFSREVKVDLNDPTAAHTLSQPVPASGWYQSPISVTIDALDGGGSGIQEIQYNLDGVDMVEVGNSTAFGLAADGVYNLSYRAMDSAGRFSAQQTLVIRIDRTAPDISISIPTGSYLLNELVLADYGCTDSASGIADCAGPVVAGSPVDTASPGSKSFVVQAVDNAGNISTQTFSYTVSYQLCVLFDQTKAYKSGSNVPIRLQLCDADGLNVSDPGIVLQTLSLNKIDNTASSTVVNTGNSNPDYEFRYDAGLGGYIYNLSTKNLSAGTWMLNFSIAGDPQNHTVVFDIR